jgi:DNA polymerase-3 subunit delta'
MLNLVQGQAEGVRFLRRVVDGHVTSPLLLVGKDGIGKKFSVLQAAKESFSKGDTTDIFHGRQIDHGLHPDLTLIQPDDNGTIKVDVVRELTADVLNYPSYAAARYVLIDGADHMNTAAANALLKMLEEPPDVVRFFLLAESADAVLPTIRSRCGLVRYRALPEAFILARIQQFEVDASKALVLTRLAEGSVGRAIGYWGSGRLRLRDQVLELLKPDLLQSPAAVFTAVDTLGADLALGIRFLEHLLHDLLMIIVAPAQITNTDIEEKVRKLQEVWPSERVYKLLTQLRVVQTHLDRGVKITLSSHVKSALLGVRN